MKLVVANLTGTNLVIEFSGTDWIFPPGCTCFEGSWVTNAIVEANGTHFIDHASLGPTWGSQITVGVHGVSVHTNPNLAEFWLYGLTFAIGLALLFWGVRFLGYLGGNRGEGPEI